MSKLYGIDVLQNQYATRRVLRVAPMPIRKRRRAWRLVWRDEPSAYQLGNMIVMHPTLYAKLPKAPA